MKRFLKYLGSSVAFIISSPGFVLFKVIKSIELFRDFGEVYSLFPGKLGRYVRAWYYHMTLKSSPMNLNMEMFSKFSYPESQVGKGVMIAAHCSIGLVTIGDNSVCAGRVSILSGRYQHNFIDPGRPILQEVNPPQRIYIGKNTFVGEGCIVMSNIGDCSIVGAGSVVVEEIADYSVAVGNPSKVVKKRKEVR
jgi:acetyltransferase-like isoleucine patch superfamily enzyme